MKNIVVVILLMFCTITYGQDQTKMRRGFISYDSSIHTSGVTFQDTMYYTGQTATDTLLWMGMNSVTKAIYSDTTKTSSFALFMDLEPIDSFMTDIHNGELKWYYMENGKIKFRYGWAEGVSERYQQLMAGIEIGLQYTWDDHKRIDYLEKVVKTNRIIMFILFVLVILIGMYAVNSYRKGLR